jgi:membrane-associated phospholipid phosphatase
MWEYLRCLATPSGIKRKWYVYMFITILAVAYCVSRKYVQ